MMFQLFVVLVFFFFPKSIICFYNSTYYAYKFTSFSLQHEQFLFLEKKKTADTILDNKLQIWSACCPNSKSSLKV